LALSGDAAVGGKRKLKRGSAGKKGSIDKERNEKEWTGGGFEGFGEPQADARGLRRKGKACEKKGVARERKIAVNGGREG